MPQNKRDLKQGLLHMWPGFCNPNLNGWWVIARKSSWLPHTWTHTDRRKQWQYPGAKTSLREKNVSISNNDYMIGMLHRNKKRDKFWGCYLFFPVWSKYRCRIIRNDFDTVLLKDRCLRSYKFGSNVFIMWHSHDWMVSIYWSMQF